MLKLIPALVCMAALALAIPFAPVHHTSVGLASEEESELYFIAKDIYIDGERFDNYSLERAVTRSAEGRIYLPATEEILKALGVGFDRDEEMKYHIFSSDEPDASLLEERRGRLVNNLDMNFSGKLGDPDYMVLRCDNLDELTELNLREMSGYRNYVIGHFLADRFEKIEKPSEDTDILSFTCAGILRGDDGMFYLPETLLEKLGVSIFEDELTGIWISSNPDVPAEETYKPASAAWINAIADVMQSRNVNLTREEAIEYEYYFRHEATVHGVDELTLLAVAFRESNFRAESVGRGDAIGLMQPLAKYAVNYGYDREMLFIPHYNIQLGAMYLRDRYALYPDDIPALSAYNQGVGAVRGGSYSTSYARRVLTARAKIEAAIAEAGGEI